MAIISIARERGAYGRIIAKKLAERLDAHFIDRDVVDSSLERLGIEQKKRDAFDERKPSFFASLTDAVEEYATCLKLVLYNEARNGNCVILGRGSQTLFKEVPGSLSVRLIASPDVRCERIAAEEHLDLNQAKQVMTRIDHNRASFNNYYFDTEWENPLNYDVVFNTGAVDVERVVTLITAMAKAIPQADIDRGRVALQDLTLAQQVERHILHVLKVPIFFLKVTSVDGAVTLHGIVHSADVIEKAGKAAFIDGVKSIDNKLEIGMQGHCEGHL